MRKRLLFLMITCMLFATNQVYSQVGINTEAPYKLTELEITNIVNGTDTSPKV